MFDKFKERIEKELFTHPIIVNNEYCKWFNSGNLEKDDIVEFTKQFSVFSNQFTIAQLNKVINSSTLEEMHDAKEILMNELGVVFKKDKQKVDDSINPEFVGIEGSVEGSTFRFGAAHFEWLLAFGKPLGLNFKDIGKRKHGSPHTLHFCDELIRLYGNGNHIIGAGASFAVENWAAAGFWKQLIQGLEIWRTDVWINDRIPLAFFDWHDKIEDQHASHTWHELQELYDKDFNENLFIESGYEMLNGVEAFWNGLNIERIVRHATKVKPFAHLPGGNINYDD